MVNIVNKEPHKSVIKEVVCKHCGVTLSYVPNEELLEIHRDYGGGSDTYYYIPCPNCGKKAGTRR